MTAKKKRVLVDLEDLKAVQGLLDRLGKEALLELLQDHQDLPTLNLEELGAAAIRQALRQTGGNVSHAARLLGISRDTLSERMRRHGIDRVDYRGAE